MEYENIDEVRPSRTMQWSDIQDDQDRIEGEFWRVPYSILRNPSAVDMTAEE